MFEILEHLLYSFKFMMQLQFSLIEDGLDDPFYVNCDGS